MSKFKILHPVLLAFAALAAGAQEDPAATGAAVGADDGEVQPVSVEDSRHIADPVFSGDIPETIEEPPPPPESDAERLRRLFTLYRNAIAESSFEEADTLGKQIVELTIETNGRNSEESARALTNLAIAQHGMGDYESAQLNFSASIDIIETVSNRLDTALINPLRGLGASQLAAGRPDLASESFERAVHVSHVNDGPHNLEQLELLESLAETYLASGEDDLTEDMQERIYILQARNIDPESVDILPALYRQARWQRRLALYDKERYTWRRVISLLEDHHGHDDLSLIAPLTELGQSYLYLSPVDVGYQQPASASTGEIYLKRALRIAEDHPDTNWRVESDAMIELADYYILTDRSNRAERMYRDAWELMSGDEERQRARYEALQTLQVLQAIQPPKFYGVDSATIPGRRPEGFETGTVVYQYAVSTRGTATDIELVEMQPAGLSDMETTVGRELRHLIQRPRLVDGDMVQTNNLTYTHSFYYRPSDLPETTGEGESLAGNTRN